jgi:hypothetical protein
MLDPAAEIVRIRLAVTAGGVMTIADLAMQYPDDFPVKHIDLA